MSKPLFPHHLEWCIDPAYVGRLRDRHVTDADDDRAEYTPAEVEVVDVRGLIEKHPTVWGERVGAASATEIAGAIDEAAADADVNGIVL